MVFSSNTFLFFFLPLVMFGYFLIKSEFQNIWLLIASLFFYAWGEPYYVVIMIFSIIANYLLGGGIYVAKTRKTRKIILVFAVLCNLGILFYFKYLNFAVDILESLHVHQFTINEIALPIGISFYTFQGLTYVIDVYRQEATVQKNPIKLGLYIAMFPQLIAGPIVRYKDISMQLDKREYNVDKCFYGIWRFVQGLAKKVIIANTVAEVADKIFAQQAGELSVATVWLGIICYTFQIYFDFSGYSDMAIGLGKILGFDFLENFDYPYTSTSITEFWRKWHISLSSFFRDYVYIPLGGNRRGNVYFNLLFIFFLTGLWHGASYNFIIWGLWHGFFIILERINKKYQIIQVQKWSFIKHIYTMFIVGVGWIFFRADTLKYGLQYLGRLFGIFPASQISFTINWYLDKYLIFILFIALIISLGGIKRFGSFIKSQIKVSVLLVGQAFIMLSLLLIDLIYVITSTYNPFIYFKF